MKSRTASLFSVLFAIVAFVVSGTARGSNVVPSNFNGYGTVVNGYQDFFTGTSLNPAWTVVGNSGDFTLPGDGTLHITGSGGDPNKLLYNGPAYNATNQSVLAMIEVSSLGTVTNDTWRGGVAAESNATTGQGINVLFQLNNNHGSGNHFNFLDDAIQWGPAASAATWVTNKYYWVLETTNGSTETASIWAADGVTPESSALSGSWTEGGRSGLAGLVADSNGGDGTFQVNYVLIEAAGLPLIDAGIAPEPSSVVALVGLCGMGLIGVVRYRRRRHSALTAKVATITCAALVVLMLNFSGAAMASAVLTNEQYVSTGASSIPVTTTGDLLLNLSALQTNYVGNNEGLGGTTAPFTDGKTATDGNADLNQNTNNQNALFDCNCGNPVAGQVQPWYVEYKLPTAGAPAGYNLTGVSVITGHGDSRVDQSYDILVSSDGVHFTSLSNGASGLGLGVAGGDFVYAPSVGGSGGSASSTVSPLTGLVLASGVQYVEFVAESDGANVYREISAFGSPVPEPSSVVALLGLCGMGLIGVVRYRRRRDCKPV
jgi:hypothetical protein